MTEPIFYHERLDVYRLSIDYVAFSYDLAKTLAGTNRHARDQWLRAAQSIPLNIADANQIGKSNLKRIVSMLTRLIQRTTGVSEDRIEYEYEYRVAEYEHEPAAET
jgi:predicted YcjX-like family ATPase